MGYEFYSRPSLSFHPLKLIFPFDLPVEKFSLGTGSFHGLIYLHRNTQIVIRIPRNITDPQYVAFGIIAHIADYRRRHTGRQEKIIPGQGSSEPEVTFR